MYYKNKILIAILPVLFASCAARLFGVLAAEELALVRTAGVRVGLVNIAVENEILFARRLAQVRIQRVMAGNPRLYVMENGVKNFFAELTSPRSLTWLKSGYKVTLPGRVFSTRAGHAAINLRGGPGTGFKILKTVPGNRLLLVLEENAGWSKVQLDDKVIGWIATALLVDALSDQTVAAGTPAVVNTKAPNTKYKAAEIRLIPASPFVVSIDSIQSVLSSRVDVNQFSIDTTSIPPRALARLTNGITIRYFSTNDQAMALAIKKELLAYPPLRGTSIKLENMLPAFNYKPIPGYIEVWNR